MVKLSDVKVTRALGGGFQSGSFILCMYWKIKNDSNETRVDIRRM